MISSILVMWYFELFIAIFTLDKLPQSYLFYGEHIKNVPIYLAPLDSVIVWLFSFSLYYNYLLYAVGLKVFKDLFTMKLAKTELEQDNLKLEYNFLKSQLNPHFLFNTLNNMYSFSVVAPGKVGDMILRLADLMRYSLYETNEEYVSLEKEITFLESYMALQRIRHDREAKIEYNLVGNTANKKITPLLLITFLENAFKHGLQSTAGANWIEISLEIKFDILVFKIRNNMVDSKVKHSGGLGLSNAYKRLSYYYPQCHNLLIQNTNSIYSVELTISLNGKKL